MTIAHRPATVGRYEVLQDFVCPEASVRVLRLEGPAESIDQHLHHKSMQLYLSLDGRVVITVDGEQKTLAPYEVLGIWPGTAHGAAPADDVATLVNISIPPLSAEDQLPVEPQPEPPDMRLPFGDSDIDD